MPAPRLDPVRQAPRRRHACRNTRAGRQSKPRGGVPRARRKERVMSGHRIAAITRRLLQGFRRDRRTLALLFVAPIVILGLLGYLMRGSSSAPQVGIANQDSGAAFVGLVVLFLVFVITIVSFLNERSQGTLERLMASPLRRGEIVVGYMLGFTVLALVQAAEVLIFALAILRIHNEGSVLLIFGMEALMAIAAVNLGIFLSMFARSEFQAVQFIPLVVVPQVLLSGIIFPVSTEPTPLQWLSDVLPLTYAVNGMRDIMVKGADLTWGSLELDAGVVLGFCVLLIVAGTTTLRRRLG